MNHPSNETLNQVNVVEIQSADRLMKGFIDLNGGMLTKLFVKRDALLKDASACEVKAPSIYNVDEDMVSVLHRAPWVVDDCFNHEPNLDAHLSGEWGCAPFGFVTKDDSLFKINAPHGLPCHSRFQNFELNPSKDECRLDYTYPEDNDLYRMERTVSLLTSKESQEGSAEDKILLYAKFKATVSSRRPCKVPLGGHPCFPLYDITKGVGDDALASPVVKLKAKFDFGMVYIQNCEDGVSRLLPQSTFTDLSKVKLHYDYYHLDGNNEECDLSKLPLPYHTEEIVQLLGLSELELVYEKLGYSILLKWDREVIPGCLLWISNQGRAYAPWNSKNLCLGVEPVASAWDMGDISTKKNPILDAGYPTYVEIKPESPVTFSYELILKKL